MFIPLSILAGIGAWISSASAVASPMGRIFEVLGGGFWATLAASTLMAYCVAGNGCDAQPPVDCAPVYKPPFANGAGASVVGDHANAPGMDPHCPHVVVGRMSERPPPRFFLLTERAERRLAVLP
jgi:hypothetical protein